jgi:hypothetical protein
VEVEQRGKKRAEYGEALLKKLASDLTARFGKGFGLANLKSIRKFFRPGSFQVLPRKDKRGTIQSGR